MYNQLLNKLENMQNKIFANVEANKKRVVEWVGNQLLYDKALPIKIYVWKIMRTSHKHLLANSEQPTLPFETICANLKWKDKQEDR